MDIGVMGNGDVGGRIAKRLEELGHGVHAGGRGTFEEVASFGELVFNCTPGEGALAAVQAAGGALDGKVLIDVCNPLVFAEGQSPTLFTGHDQSLAEQLQAAAPNARVVKALNTVTSRVMVHPELVAGEHVLPICGDDADAKAQVTALLGEIGWPEERVVDLGGLDAARATEAYILLWLRLMGTEGSPVFNIEVHSAA